MSAIPVISAGVSAVGTLAGIRQQSQAADAQASALDDERTRAIIAADQSNAEQRQQFLIAKTQQEIEFTQSKANFELAQQSSQLQREQYRNVTEQQQLQLDTSRLALQENADTAKATIEQQRLTQQSNLQNNKAQTDASIADAQSQLLQAPEGQLNALQQLSLANRANRFFGTTGAQTSATIAEADRSANASIDQLNTDANANERLTNEAASVTDAISQEAQTINDQNLQLGILDLNNNQSELDANVATADRTLSEFQSALQLAIDSNASSETLNALLLEETNKAQQRSTQLGLQGSLSLINNQASQIQRPGFIDLLNGGLGVFNVFNQLQDQTKKLSETNAQIKANNATRNNVIGVSNPYFGQPVKGQYQGNGLNVGLEQNSILSNFNFQQAQNSRVDNAGFQTGTYDFVNPYVKAPAPAVNKPAVKPLIRKPTKINVPKYGK
jgi:hypothetical protein